jgi:hypothetical protein
MGSRYREVVPTRALVTKWPPTPRPLAGLLLGMKVAKVVKVLERGLWLAEIVTLTGISRASVKRYGYELASSEVYQGATH